jgi:DNA-binding NtrC family response regulator
LRERKEEIPVLIRYFVKKFADKYAKKAVVVSDELMEKCMRYGWPGNLRQLENFVKRFLVLGDERVMIAELSDETSGIAGHLASVSIPEQVGGLKKMVSYLKGKAEAEAISQVLQRNKGNRKQTAAELNISYKALLYKIRQYGIIDRHSEV